MHMQTLKPGLAKYAVDVNLFRLGSTNSKKNIHYKDAFAPLRQLS